MKVRKGEVVIRTHYIPRIGKYYAIAIQYGVKGTHEQYNVLYNGGCQDRSFYTEAEAMVDALVFTKGIHNQK